MTQTPGNPQGGTPPLNLPGLDFSLDFSSPATPATGGVPPAAPAGGLDFGGLTFNLGGSATPPAAPPPAGPGRPAMPPPAAFAGGGGLPDLGFNLGAASVPNKSGGSALDMDFGLPGLDLPSFDLGGGVSAEAPAPRIGGGMPKMGGGMPKMGGGMPKMSPPPKVASFLDESPSAGASLGFSSSATEDVLGLGSKVERSILDDTDVLAQPTAVVETGSKKKFFFLTLAVAVVVVLAFGGLWTVRYSLRATLKGMVLNGTMSRAARVGLGEGVDRKALLDALGSLRSAAVANKAVEIYDLQVVGQDFKDLTRDGILDAAEYGRILARVQYLKSIKTGR